MPKKSPVKVFLLFLSMTVLAGLVSPVEAAGQGLRRPATASGEAPRPMPESWWKLWDGQSGLDIKGDPRLRKLVEDIAIFDEDVENREAAQAALNVGTDDAIMTYLTIGADEARARAATRKKETAQRNRTAIEAMAGTGGPYFNGEVTRVLAGTDYDRDAFLAYGAEIAKARDDKTARDAKARADLLRSRVRMLVGVGGSEVQKAAQAALDAGTDAAIDEFLKAGYLVAAKKDAEAREAYLKELEERNKAAEQLSELAKRAARAAQARKNLVIAHGNGVHALQRAANAMVSASNEARHAAQILAANETSGAHSPDSFADAKREVARQLGYANDAAFAAKQAAASATIEANVLVEVDLPYGAQWSAMATGMENAARAAVGAVETAQHAIDATIATDGARDARDKAEKHAEQAHQWRLHAEEHARSAAQLAEAARLQAVAAQDALARARQARIDAEAAEQQAWAAAGRAHEARVNAEAEQHKAAAARQTAERERAIAADERAKTDKEAASARSHRGDAERLAGVAHEARVRADAQKVASDIAADAAEAEDRKAADIRAQAFAAEQNRQAAEARAQAMGVLEVQAKGTDHEKAAKDAATKARGDADAATTAAIGSRNAADAASGAAVNARIHATEAGRAAARARAAADQAKAAAAEADRWAAAAEYAAAEAHKYSEQANAKAAEATEAEVKAAEHARSAVQLAEQAAFEASQSLRAAERTRDEANAAAAESVSAATQAEMAIRAATAARASSNGITDPANTAITVVAPFTGADIDADFVVEVANQARQVGKEQAAAAETRAEEAKTAATAARKAADSAAAEVKPAFEAAAQAAASAAAAARSAADAQKAAADAATEGAAARASGERAQQADRQAGNDARAARTAANIANNDAVIAGKAADAAERDAVAANKAAKKAEDDAELARSAATQAETDAAAARDAARQAQENADRATKAADGIKDKAVEIQQAADRAEEQARRDEAERRRQVALQANGGNGLDLTEDELELVFYEGGDELVEEFQNANSTARRSIGDFFVEIGAEVLNDLLGIDDAKKCFGEGNVESCLWTVINIGDFLSILGKVTEVGAALIKVVRRIGPFLESVGVSKRVLEKTIDLLEKARGNPCYRRPVPRMLPDASGAGGSHAVKSATSSENPCIKWTKTSRPTFGHTFTVHQAGAKNTKKLIDRARAGTPQGQWLDDDAAVEFLKNAYRPGFQVTVVEIPKGLGQVIMPDGSMVSAGHALLVPALNGLYKTAYPYIPRG
ncbi:hypothetical protein GCM10009754_06100 [Amycolatopsis minnesotensis]|uniref:Methyl-accepting transducer domain-containing protein n=1 Tax=Amycolatopsis minnesotensis TaxID=337894 RepID=A0ABP5BEZ9_9PSEU